MKENVGKKEKQEEQHNALGIESGKHTKFYFNRFMMIEYGSGLTCLLSLGAGIGYVYIFLLERNYLN